MGIEGGILVRAALNGIDITGSRSRIVDRPLPGDDPQQRRPDISRARLLTWAPKTQLKEGLILLTIAYFEKLLAELAKANFRRAAPPASALPFLRPAARNDPKLTRIR